MLLGIVLSVLVSLPAHADLVEPDTEYLVFHHRDVLGTAIATTDSNGNVVHHTSTTPYGRDLGRRADDGQGFSDNAYPSSRSGEGYTGHVNDRQLELTYMRARFYDPVLGRFLSNDPVGFTSENPTSFNRYAYANNSPYNYVDPDGRYAETVLDIVTTSIEAGHLLGGIAAYTVGRLRGDSNLVDVAKEGMAQEWGDVALSLGGILAPGATSAMFVGVGKAAKSGRKLGPAPNGGVAKTHGGTAHNQAIDSRVTELANDPTVTNIRKNQAQVDVNGNRVGSNRPDLQYDQHGCHNCVEYDNSTTNSFRHGEQIQANDPDTNIELNKL